MVETALFSIILIASSIIDIKTQKIPNIITISSFLLFFLLYWINDAKFPTNFIIQALITFIIMLILCIISKGKLGMGDVKLTLTIGGVLGIYYWFISIFIAAFSALFFIVIALILKKIDKKAPIPFAPFLSAGALISLWLLKENYFAL